MIEVSRVQRMKKTVVWCRQDTEKLSVYDRIKTTTKTVNKINMYLILDTVLYNSTMLSKHNK